MKLVTKKAERRQAQEQQNQIVRAANYGYSVGFNTAMDVVYMSIGSALIAAVVANTIVDQSYKRNILKLSKTDFNIDKTLVHMSKKMTNIVDRGERGYKKFCKFLFDCNKEGFDFWNPDISRMILNIGFDNYRDHVGELGIIVEKLDGKGKDLIKFAFTEWKEHGSNVFPFGSASGWKDLLVKDYELTRNLTKIKVLLNSIKSGTIQESDVQSLNTLFGFIETEYAGSRSQMLAQSTENCAAYRNAEHYVEQIYDLLENTFRKFGVEFRISSKHLRIRRVDASVVQKIKSSRLDETAKQHKGGLFKFIGGGTRTVKPPKSEEEEAAPTSKKRQDEEDDLDDFGDDFFDDEDEEEDADDFDDDDENFEEVPSPRKKKSTKKPQSRKKTPKPEPEEEQEPDEEETDTDSEEETPVDEEEELKAAKAIADIVVGLKRAKTVSQKKRLSKNLHSAVAKYCDKYGVTEEEFLNAYPEVKEVF